MKLSEWTDHAVKYARWQHPATRRGARWLGLQHLFIWLFSQTEYLHEISRATRSSAVTERPRDASYH